MAFLFGLAVPAIAVARQAIDPVAFATICRVDPGEAGGSTLPGSLQEKLKSAHCLMCLGTASPPASVNPAPVIVGTVAGLTVVFPRSSFVADDPAALQPLNPRAPPRA
ncbi:MAG: hypothetical protein KF834_09695 [Burkholderiales bacterium]|nr:hypothetical protein [Burkholderiales bacterium]